MTIRQIISHFRHRLRNFLLQSKRRYPDLYQLTQKRERPIVLIFGFLIVVLLLRLFILQVVDAKDYDAKLLSNHESVSNLKAQRGHIYVTDRSGAGWALTENITLYNVFVDPKFVKDKERLISIMTPLVYLHLCQINGFEKTTREECVRNVESFTKKDILPKAPQVMYYGSGIISTGYDSFDWTGYDLSFQKTISGFTSGQATTMISEKLHDLIRIGERKYNYVGYFTDKVLLDSLAALKRPYIHIFYNNYVFIEPRALPRATSKAIKELSQLFSSRGFDDVLDKLDANFTVQEYRYIKLMSDVHPSIIDALNKLQVTYYKTRIDGIPLLHGIGTESYTKRYYPYHSFMSHIIGYLDPAGIPYYGIEEYFDNVLRGIDGRIEWRSSAWMGQVGANDFTIKNVENGYDVYLTIDPVIQRQVETIANKYREKFNSDSVSVLVYNPRSGQLIASVNAPFFDPNSYNDIYSLRPVAPAQAYLIDDPAYVDFPIFVQTGGETRVATSSERLDTTLPKYVSNNPLWPNLFIDKNIAFPYEPGSIFKWFTYGIGLDTKEIDQYDQYDDPNSEIKLEIGTTWQNGKPVPLYRTIGNAEKEACRGTHSFLYALQHSCNVGMIRIVEKITKQVFYNYLEKLGFGSLSHIELAGEDPGTLPSVSSVSRTTFFNNAFGQWLLATPLQIAVAYGTLLNGGYYVKPTLLDKICESGTEKCQHNKTKILRQILDPEVSEQMKFALTKVIELPVNGKYSDVPGYQVWGKSWTSQIAYKGKYKDGRWWTNGSYVGIVTKDNLKYLIVVQIRRARTSQWWNQTAGAIFKDTASFLINYETMQGEKFQKKTTKTDYSNVKDAWTY